MMNLMDITTNLMNTTCAAKLSVILGEYVNTPKLQNPALSGVSEARKSLFSRFFNTRTARK